MKREGDGILRLETGNWKLETGATDGAPGVPHGLRTARSNGTRLHASRFTLHASRRAPERRAGFTLVEVLVVLVIIAVLIASVLGGLKAAQRSAWRVKSRDTARQLVAAWNLYLLDNREFPDQGTMADATEGGYAASAANLDLLNADKLFIELSDEEHENGLKDKWGRYFGFNLDFDYNGEIENPAPEASGKNAKSFEVVRGTVIAWSQGATPTLKKTWIVQW